MSSDHTRGPTLETARLRGEPVRARDLDDLHEIFGDPEVTRTLGGLRTPEQIQQIFQRFDASWRETGHGPWFFRDASGNFVGYAGVIATRVDGVDGVELLYALTAARWNQGYASEMAESCVAAAFDRLGIGELFCFTLTTNRASQRVMEKAGFRYVRDITHVTLPHVLYRQTATQWRLRAGREQEPREAQRSDLGQPE